MEFIMHYWLVPLIVAIWLSGWLFCYLRLGWPWQQYRDTFVDIPAMLALCVAVAAFVHSFQSDLRAQDKDREDLNLRILAFSKDYQVLPQSGCSDKFPVTISHIFEIQLINNGACPINVVDCECEQTDTGFCSNQPLVPELYSDELTMLELPISLSPGEAKKFAVSIGINLGDVAADIVLDKFPRIQAVSADSIEAWLSAKGLDYWGNKKFWVEYDEKVGNVIVINTERNCEIFDLTLVTSRGNRFARTFTAGMNDIEPLGTNRIYLDSLPFIR